MKNTMRRFSALLLALAMVLTLTACWGGKKDAPAASAVETVEAGAGEGAADGDGAELS